MPERAVRPWVKMALELGPIVVFFVAYLKIKDDVFTIGGTEYAGFMIATAVFIPLILLATGILWLLTGSLSRMQVVTAVLVTVFGAMTIWFNDPKFFKMKPTIVYLIFAGVLTYGLWRGRSYLALLMGELLPLTDAGWMILTRRLAAFFFILAVANEIVWRTLSEGAWVNFKTFGLTAALFLFFIAQARFFERHAKHPSTTSNDEANQ